MMMKNTYTHTADTFTAANGEIFNANQVLATVNKTMDLVLRKKGWRLYSEDRQDIFQDISEKLGLNFGTFNPEKGKLSVWLYSTVSNALVDFFGAVTVKTPSTFDGLDDDDPAKALLAEYPELSDGCQYFSRREPLEYKEDTNDRNDVSWFIRPEFELLAGGRTADYELECREMCDRLERAIGRLPENQRYVFNLNRDGYKPKEIAEMLGCTPNTVSILLCRAKKTLRAELEGDYSYGIAA